MTAMRNIFLVFALTLVGACSDRTVKFAEPVPEVPAASAGVVVDAALPTGDDAASIYARTCTTCHGKTGEGVGTFPSLAKLDRAMLQARLEAYRAGQAVGPRSSIMEPIAKTLSDEQIAALASYLGS